MIIFFTAIEREIDVSDYRYVHAGRFINWLQTFDHLGASKKLFFPLNDDEVVDECLDPLVWMTTMRYSVPDMLSFLLDMGMLMWHDETSI